MKLDYKLREIVFEIKKEIREEDNIDISIQEICAVSNSQVIATIFAFTKGIETRIHKIGAFKRRFMGDIKERRIKLDKAKDTLTDEQLAKFDLELRMDRKKWNARRAKVIRKITLEELLSAPVITDNPNKYKKLNV